LARYDFTSHRLYVEADLAAGLPVALDRAQANYLINVLRLSVGAELLLFNGRDGEWRARIVEANKRNCLTEAVAQTRPQTTASDIWYCFAPLKAARLDYIVQKAVEMGAGRIVPMLTRHTQVSRLNVARLRANVIEAAEQCGVLNVPDTTDEMRLDRLLAALPAERRVIFCDENAETTNPLAALGAAANAPLAVLIGPEGGFAAEERAMLLARPGTLRLSLGPRILRADTAGVAAMALVQATMGDWR
jgi:16S rRNA (uracil1498-N3)-methyltransferase